MRVVTGSEMHQIDRFTIDKIGLGEEVLMENAGRAVFTHMKQYIDKADTIAILIGAGNNGGDGFVIARYLLEDNYKVDVWVVPQEDRIKGTARYHMNVFKRAGYEYKQVDMNGGEPFYSSISLYTVIIDSLLGTGVKGSIREPYDKMIAAINRLSNKKIIAVDLPSGVPADGGELVSEAVLATHTVTLQCPKIGAFTFPVANYYGILEVVDIGIPKNAVETIAKQRFLWREEEVKHTLPVRKRQSHKSDYGKGFIIAGSLTMTGAAILTAKACHRAGAGLVTLAVPDCIHSIVANKVIEATFVPCPSENGQFKSCMKNWQQLAELFDAIAIGPGIGRSQAVGQMVEEVLRMNKALVLDADALFHLKDFLPALKERRSPTILTPHSGEMARLLGVTVAELEQNRFYYSEQFAKEYGVFLVLKGPYTIVATPSGQQYINTTGNPALAKGGSGDVLTGIILAQLLQQTTVQEAISNAVFLHGKAADLLVEEKASQYDVVASDIISYLPRTFKTILSR